MSRHKKNGKLKYTNREFYKDKYELHGGTTKGVGWDGSENKSMERYRECFSMIDGNFSDLTLCEVGCGTGMGYRMYGEHFLDYVGVDAQDYYVSHCYEKYSMGKFLCRDVSETLIPKVDVAVACGVFTINVGMSDKKYKEKFFDSLHNMLMQVDKCLIINGFGTKVDYEHENLYYHDLGELMWYLTDLGFAFELKAYQNKLLPYEFFLKIDKKIAIGAINTKVM